MTHSKLGWLCICAVTLGLTVFSAPVAQAESGAKWLLASGSELLSFLEASVGLEGETFGIGVLHTKISGISVLWECSSINTVNAKLKTEGKIGEGSKVKFSECITKLNGATSGSCVPKAGGKESGVIVTNALHGLLILHELAGGVKDDIIKVLPDSGETMAIIEMGEECAIGEKVPVIGKATIKDSEGLALTHLVKHLMEIGPLTELWTISKTAEHVSTLLGSAWMFLTGTHEGLKFNGDPA
jgi:hypothetical protein